MGFLANLTAGLVESEGVKENETEIADQDARSCAVFRFSSSPLGADRV